MSDGRIPEHKIDEVRQAANIAEVIGRRVKLITAGKTLKGLCPFHGDTDPSFIVNRERGTWHCFGCGEGGNVFTFLMKDEGLSFPEAVKELAARYGVKLPRRKRSPAQKRQDEQRARLLRVMELAGTFFVQQLAAPSGEPARRYLKDQRGLGSQVIRDFGLGWAPDAWEGLRRFLGAQGVPEELAIAAGLLVPRDKGDGCYDRFRGRVMFPIADVAGRLVSFGGRVLGGGEPKYLNGPETLLFKKSATLYNLERARPFMRKKDRALVVEGYFDVITLAAMGFGETVAPLGTALTPQQVRRLKGQASRLVLVFDGDDAGRRAARRSLPICLAEGVQPQVLLLPSGEDPDSFARSQGPEGLEKAIAGAQSLIQEVLDNIIAEGDPKTPEGKSKIVAQAGGVLKAIKDEVVSWDYLRRLSGSLNTSPEVVASRLGMPLPGGRPSPVRPQAEVRAPADSSWQEHLLSLALNYPEAARILAEAGVLASIDRQDLKTVSQVLLGLLEQGRQTHSDAVIDAVEDSSLQGLISRIAQNGLVLNEEDAAAEARSIARTYQAKFAHKDQRQRLRAELAKAERDGDQARREELLLQLRQLRLDQASSKPFRKE